MEGKEIQLDDEAKQLYQSLEGIETRELSGLIGLPKVCWKKKNSMMPGGFFWAKRFLL
jgi:hypothetical protein